MPLRRREFSAATKRGAYARCNGICECHLIPHVFAVACGRPLGVGNTFYEHIDPDAISGRNDLDNCAAPTKTCWRIKTDTYDRKVIAKSNHVRDKLSINTWSPSRRPLPFGRDDKFKQKIGGTVVLRSTGEPWRPGR